MKLTSLQHFFACLLMLTLFTACGVSQPSPYHRPDLQLPPTWSEMVRNPESPRDQWWQDFGDPVLDSLIDEALQRNNDLAAAAILAYQAWLRAEQADSDRLPSLKVGGSAGLDRGFGSDGTETKSFGVSAALSYELDLWGRLSHLHDASVWEAIATEEDRDSAALSLIGTTASLYWQLAYLNQRLALSADSIAYARKTLELVQVQKQSGAATALEVLEAQRSLASQEASHANLVQQRVEVRNTLAILFDGPPQNLDLQEPANLQGAHLPEVRAGMPAELLARRPDLRAAEARLRAALADTDAVRSSFYPTFNLSGSYGGSSEKLSRLFSNPIAALAADLTLPFVQWRDMRRSIRISEAEYERLVINFRQSLYQALAEVENCLVARKQYIIQEEKLSFSLQAARETERLYGIRYQAGAVPLNSWLDAQENRRQAEVALAENRLNQLYNQITLYKALGGGMKAKKDILAEK